MNQQSLHRVLVACFAIALITLVPSAFADRLLTKEQGQDILQLGKIKVEGTPEVLRVLQIIKQGLREPYSNDPKLANVVVCRLNTQAGSHVRQTLICATNRGFSSNRDAIQEAAAAARASESTGICSSAMCSTVTDEQVFSVLNETLDSLPGRTLKTSVDAAEFHALLEKVPDKAAQPAKPKQAGKTATSPNSTS